MSFLSFIFGDPSDKKLKKYQKHLENIRPIEAKYATQIHTLQDVHAQTMYFRGLFAGLDIDIPEDKTRIYQILADIQLEAFALHRRTCQIISGQEFAMQNGTTYSWDMVPYDVQIVGAMCLIDGNISEMRTGEGKTLVATIAAYLGALVGIPVHIVTVNDYLARRDAMEMGIIYNALGLTVGTIVHGQDPDTKKSMYACDVVYATNNELGFDYLRDNMAISTQRQSVGKKFFAIIDEVDSILIDEARTPLIISAPDNEPTTKYIKFAAMAKNLVPTTDYKIDEKQRTATLTEAGIQKIEGYLGVENIYISDHYNDLHHVENALKAQSVYTRDVEYLVRGQEVMIIDEHTGRVLSGRRYSDGLHQAIEAKE
jgi:preprotein translocase subunit SecA